VSANEKELHKQRLIRAAIWEHDADIEARAGSAQRAEIMRRCAKHLHDHAVATASVDRASQREKSARKRQDHAWSAFIAATDELQAFDSKEAK
jgi:SHS2 domain-containing protein